MKERLHKNPTGVLVHDVDQNNSEIYSAPLPFRPIESWTDFILRKEKWGFLLSFSIGVCCLGDYVLVSYDGRCRTTLLTFGSLGGTDKKSEREKWKEKKSKCWCMWVVSICAVKIKRAPSWHFVGALEFYYKSFKLKFCLVISKITSKQQRS